MAYDKKGFYYIKGALWPLVLGALYYETNRANNKSETNNPA